MSTWEIVLWLLGGTTVLMAVIITLILLQKYRHNRNHNMRMVAQEIMDHVLHNEPYEPKKVSSWYLLQQYLMLRDQIHLSRDQQIKIITELQLGDLLKTIQRRAKSIFVHKRIVAIYQLELLHVVINPLFLHERLQKETRQNVRFAIVYALLPHMNQDVFDWIMDSLDNSLPSYQEKVATICSNHFESIQPYAHSYIHYSKKEYIHFWLHIAKRHSSSELTTLIEMMFSVFKQNPQNEEITPYLSIISSYLYTHHPEKLFDDAVQIPYHPSVFYVQLKLEFERRKDSSWPILFQKLHNDTKDIFISVCQELIQEDRFWILAFIEYYHELDDMLHKVTMLEVLSQKIPYMIVRLQFSQPYIRTILRDLLNNGYTAEIIDFLNSNNESEMEQLVWSTISEIIVNNPTLLLEFRHYVREDILQRNGLTRHIPEKIPRPPQAIEKDKVKWIFTMLLIVIVFLPLTFTIRRFALFGHTSLFQLIEYYIVDANQYFVLYYMFANSIYLILIGLSIYGSTKQLRLWNSKSQRLLYEEHLLPSISIIAPAYNEEKSIVQSISSLLNISYPEYEIVVVNDGSTDGTLHQLINHFTLTRKNKPKHLPLLTRDIRGIYTNPDFPGLVVIDKVNGGKADALNVGINISSKQYICGIDADGILDPDSLLRMSAVTLDERHDIIAFGGNILPANGSIIVDGALESFGFAKQLIPRMQTLEYLRAFTTGRVGWSQINSLLIISGAFGLFDKSRLISIGGYISSSGILKKDSVGEDMELVVRLTHEALSKKEPYFVKYIFHANCYTELPSDTKTLLRQRNRWHRGLLDILSYYRNMFLRPRYKQIGLLALPYFYIFEVLGPFVDVIGYTVLVIGLLLGMLSPSLVLAIFTVSIWLGIVISLMSLLIAEKDRVMYSLKDTVLLIVFAFLENFGYRQLLSFHRAYSTFTALKDSGKWGEQKRRGFTPLKP